METLLQNIKDNEDYDELEFIVLDYNSQDGMEGWIRENFSEYISNGKVIYYRTFEPSSFSHSHAKNLAFKLASGDIICNINADHYAGAGFAGYINHTFNEDSNIVLTPIDFHKTKKDYHPSKDVLGRVCVRKNDFLKVKGFDEHMNTYGFEDYDLVNRLEMVSVKRVLIEDFSFLKFISHDNEERYSLKTSLDNIHSFYVYYCTPSISELIFLYKDHQFKKGTLLDNSTIGADDYRYSYLPRNNRFEYTIKDSQWIRGKWNDNSKNNHVDFDLESGNGFILNKNVCNSSSILVDERKEKTFYPITNPEVIRNLVIFIFFFQSRAIMEKNLSEKRIEGNDKHFGKAVVFKNFQFDLPIPI